jgi:hypothetical protein
MTRPGGVYQRTPIHADLIIFEWRGVDTLTPCRIEVLLHLTIWLSAIRRWEGCDSENGNPTPHWLGVVLPQSMRSVASHGLCVRQMVSAHPALRTLCGGSILIELGTEYTSADSDGT